MLCSLELRTDLGVAKVVLHGGAKGTAADRLREVLGASLASGISHVIVDLRHLASVDVHLAAVLSRAGRVLSAQQGSLRVVCVHPTVRATLNGFGVTDRVLLFVSAADAGWPPDEPPHRRLACLRVPKEG